MATFQVRTKGNVDPAGKPRVYFTCHREDFVRYFDKLCEDIFKTHDCAIYYTQNMEEALDEENIDVDLDRMNLFVVPVTFRLMDQPCRAMQVDIAYAKERKIAILPFMMESGIDGIYALPKNFGERQYLSPFSNDSTEISYEEKLKKYLDAVLISDEMAKRVRAAFDAYIFLSYRKKDRRHANELMKIIHNIPGCRDIAIWYDEFLTPGESFVENIEKAMSKSQLFTLLVTPNLLENGNFVMNEEYPAARRANMKILPTEMVKTDREELISKFSGIPTPVYPTDGEFGSIMAKALSRVAMMDNDDEPEHNFLIGIAYLNGIDVEKNVERGIKLITMAAEAGLPEAMEMLYNIYLSGIQVEYNIFEAQKWAERLSDYYTDDPDSDDKIMLLWTHNLCYTYHMSGNVRAAAILGETVLEHKAKLLGEEHPDTLMAINNLALVYRDMGEEHAGKYYQMIERAYNIARRTLGEEHPDTLLYLSNLGIAMQAVGDFNSAKEVSERVYQIRARVLGEEHPRTIESLSDVALSYLNLGDRVGACRIEEQVYALNSKNYGEDNIKTVIALDLLCISYYHLGNLAKAKELAERGYAIVKENLGDAHPISISYLNTLGLIYQGLGKYCDARRIQEKALELHENSAGFKNILYLNLRNNLALTYFKLGMITPAIKVQEKVYALQSEILGEDNPAGFKFEGNLAVFYGAAKRNEDMIKIEEKLYAKRKAHLGERHPDTILSLYNLATAYSNTRKYGKACELLEKVCELRRDNPNEQLNDKIASVRLLMSLYIVTFKWKKAAGLFKEYYNLAMKQE